MFEVFDFELVLMVMAFPDIVDNWSIIAECFRIHEGFEIRAISSRIFSIRKVSWR